MTSKTLHGAAAVATAHPRHAGAVAHRRPAREGAFRLSAASDSGYLAAPAAASYQGSGAEIFRRTALSAYAPGTASERDSAAQQSATGGPSGGLPNNGSGP